MSSSVVDVFEACCWIRRVIIMLILLWMLPNVCLLWAILFNFIQSCGLSRLHLIKQLYRFDSVICTGSCFWTDKFALVNFMQSVVACRKSRIETRHLSKLKIQNMWIWALVRLLRGTPLKSWCVVLQQNWMQWRTSLHLPDSPLQHCGGIMVGSWLNEHGARALVRNVLGICTVTFGANTNLILIKLSDPRIHAIGWNFYFELCDTFVNCVIQLFYPKMFVSLVILTIWPAVGERMMPRFLL